MAKHKSKNKKHAIAGSIMIAVLIVATIVVGVLGYASTGFENWDTETWFAQSTSNAGNGAGSNADQPVVESAVAVGDIVDGFYFNADCMSNLDYFKSFECSDDNAKTIASFAYDDYMAEDEYILLASTLSAEDAIFVIDALANGSCENPYDENDEDVVDALELVEDNIIVVLKNSTNLEDTDLPVENAFGQFTDGFEDGFNLDQPDSKVKLLDEPKALVYVNPEFDFDKLMSTKRDYFDNIFETEFVEYADFDGDFSSLKWSDVYVNTNVSAEDIACLPKIVIATVFNDFCVGIEGSRDSAPAGYHFARLSSTEAFHITDGLLIDEGKIYKYNRDNDIEPACIFNGSEWLVDDEYFEFEISSEGKKPAIVFESEPSDEQIAVFNDLIKIID